MCEQQYFIEYVLGIRGPSNKKADKGTICHKILEILAFIKQNQQNDTKEFNDDIIGKINIDDYDLNKITDQVYNYYTKQFNHHEWTDKDLKDCGDWVNKAVSLNNGMFDPRNRHILCPEQHFDILIEKPWSKYSYDTGEGLLEGYLGLKGTIDLITKVDDNTIEVIDWKTGRRLDWATGKEKTHEKLQTDPQLMIYHYAISKLFPQYDYIILTIYFINDGGPYSIVLGREDLERTETMLKNKFDIIKKTKKPRLHKSWMCSKLCHFGKTTFETSDTIQPKIEYRDNQVCKKDTFMTKCEQIKHDIELNGMNSTIEDYKNPNHSFAKYKAPGSVE
jgi:ATP-dependent helicase/DNAse subunit B